MERIAREVLTNPVIEEFRFSLETSRALKTGAEGEKRRPRSTRASRGFIGPVG